MRAHTHTHTIYATNRHSKQPNRSAHARTDTHARTHTRAQTRTHRHTRTQRQFDTTQTCSQQHPYNQMRQPKQPKLKHTATGMLRPQAHMHTHSVTTKTENRHTYTHTQTHTLSLVVYNTVQYEKWVHTWSICQSNLQILQRKLQHRPGSDTNTRNTQQHTDRTHSVTGARGSLQPGFSQVIPLHQRDTHTHTHTLHYSQNRSAKRHQVESLKYSRRSQQLLIPKQNGLQLSPDKYTDKHSAG